MLGILSREQIVHVLQAQYIGRIGCYGEGKVYIVPINYAYHDGYIYAHSKEGLKIHIMRQNPAVCFEVDQIENQANWRSVILWGTFEELRYPGRGADGMRILQERLQPILTGETFENPAIESAEPHLAEKPLRPIAFRIKITESSGRYEKSELLSFSR